MAQPENETQGCGESGLVELAISISISKWECPWLKVLVRIETMLHFYANFINPWSTIRTIPVLTRSGRPYQGHSGRDVSVRQLVLLSLLQSQPGATVSGVSNTIPMPFAIVKLCSGIQCLDEISILLRLLRYPVPFLP